MFHLLFTRSAVFRRLGCFYFLAIRNNAAMNFLVQVVFFFFNVDFLFLLGIYLQTELLDHIFTLLSILQTVPE